LKRPNPEKLEPLTHTVVLMRCGYSSEALWQQAIASALAHGRELIIINAK
jgi:hypothetical protein